MQFLRDIFDQTSGLSSQSKLFCVWPGGDVFPATGEIREVNGQMSLVFVAQFEKPYEAPIPSETIDSLDKPIYENGDEVDAPANKDEDEDAASPEDDDPSPEEDNDPLGLN